MKSSRTANDMDVAAPERAMGVAVDAMDGDAIEEPEPIAWRAGVAIGELVGMSERAIPLVIFRGQPGTAAVAARSTAPLTENDIGRQVTLAFEDGDTAKPIILGVLQDLAHRRRPDAAGRVEVEGDGTCLTITASEQLILRCGAASLTLSREGKVMIRGAYVSSHSAGVNRIKGGCVQIN